MGSIRIRFVKILITFIVLLVTIHVYGKTKPNNQFYNAEKKIKDFFLQLALEKEDYKKEIINDSILVLFRQILKEKESFEFSFELLKNKIGFIKSADKKVRIICWNLPYKDGTHQYCAFIQYVKSKRNYSFFELKDKSETIKKTDYAVLNKDNWYGALYYKILVNKYKGHVYYTLLAVDLNDLFTKKKIIDVLSFDDNHNPVFGANVFKNYKSAITRVVFEYSAQANMVLTYDEKKEMIVFDHLSPSRPGLKGQYEFYGPDFSYDGFKFEKGIWNSYLDIDVRNDKDN